MSSASGDLAFVFQSIRLSLIGTAYRIVKDRQTAEDVAQETFMRASDAARQRPIEHVEAYLHQTARNLALDHLRRRKTRERWEESGVEQSSLADIASSGSSPEAQLMEQQQVRLLEAALEQLPDRTRRVWALVRSGWTYAAIGEHLGVSRNTVYNDFKLAMGHCHDALARQMKPRPANSSGAAGDDKFVKATMSERLPHEEFHTTNGGRKR